MPFIFKIILVLVLIIAAEIYFYKKFRGIVLQIFKITPSKKFNAINYFLILFLNLYPIYLLSGLIYSVIFRDGFPPQPDGYWFDFLILVPFWLGVFIVIQSLLFIFIIDFIKLLFYPYYKKRKENLTRYYNLIVFIIVTFFVLYVPINAIYNYTTVQIRNVDFYKKDLPEQLNNFRITFISDIHADKYTNTWRLQNYIDKVNSTKPDLVLIGGDIISSTPDYINFGASYLGKIKSKYGVFSCVGDHDNWAYRPDYLKSRLAVMAALKRNGVLMYDDKDTTLNISGSSLGITFATETYSDRVDDGDRDSLIDNLTADLKILLVHQPRNSLINAAAQKKYDLFLAGHTHGGQVSFLFPFINLSVTLFETRYVRGNFWFGNMLMIVTRGLGMSIEPIRYNSQPEITVINLKKK